MKPQIWGKTGGKIYGPMAGEDYEDNQLRFSLLCRVRFFIHPTCMLSLSHFHQQQRRILLRAARLNAELLYIIIKNKIKMCCLVHFRLIFQSYMC